MLLLTYIEVVDIVSTTKSSIESMERLHSYCEDANDKFERMEASLLKFPVVKKLRDILYVLSLIHTPYQMSAQKLIDKGYFQYDEDINFIARKLQVYNLSESTQLSRKNTWNTIKVSLQKSLDSIDFTVQDDLMESERILHEKLKKALNGFENKNLEYKATIFVPVYSKREKASIKSGRLDEAALNKIKALLSSAERKKEVENSFIKALCGFMNTEGGDIIVGIDEDEIGMPIDIGLSTDLKKFNGNEDEYFRRIENLIKDRIGNKVGNHYRLEVIEFESKKYLFVSANKSLSPIFAKIKSTGDFYIRKSGESVLLSSEEALFYYENHFKNIDSLASVTNLEVD